MIKSQKTENVYVALNYNPTAQFVSKSDYLLGNGTKANVILLHFVTQPAPYTTIYLNYMDLGPLQFSQHDDLKVLLAFFD
jgi:lipopolysaccharide biosynthesis glycosyltransferase